MSRPMPHDTNIEMGKGLPSPRRRVLFKPPKGMPGATQMSGTITHWTPFRRSTRRRRSRWRGWGEYIFQAQRIHWDDGRNEIRLVYYRRNDSGSPWQFASQTTVSSDLRTIKALCRDVLDVAKWRRAGWAT
jgi:hypothetical protein